MAKSVTSSQPNFKSVHIIYISNTTVTFKIMLACPNTFEPLKMVTLYTSIPSLLFYFKSIMVEYRYKLIKTKKCAVM